MSKKIYLDMDGVLANFDDYYFRNGRHSFIYEEFRQEVMDNKLFENLPKMVNMDELVDSVRAIAEKHNYEIEILSSVHTLYDDQYSESCKQKRKWLVKNGMGDFQTNFVKGRTEKGTYGSDGDILIDDQLTCVHYFNENGGVGIGHKNVIDTLTLLQKVIADRKLQEVRLAS